MGNQLSPIAVLVVSMFLCCFDGPVFGAPRGIDAGSRQSAQAGDPNRATTRQPPAKFVVLPGGRVVISFIDQGKRVVEIVEQPRALPATAQDQRDQIIAAARRFARANGLGFSADPNASAAIRVFGHWRVDSEDVQMGAVDISLRDFRGDPAERQSLYRELAVAVTRLLGPRYIAIAREFASGDQPPKQGFREGESVPAPYRVQRLATGTRVDIQSNPEASAGPGHSIVLKREARDIRGDNAAREIGKDEADPPIIFLATPAGENRGSGPGEDIEPGPGRYAWLWGEAGSAVPPPSEPTSPPEVKEQAAPSEGERVVALPPRPPSEPIDSGEADKDSAPTGGKPTAEPLPIPPEEPEDAGKSEEVSAPGESEQAEGAPVGRPDGADEPSVPDEVKPTEGEDPLGQKRGPVDPTPPPEPAPEQLARGAGDADTRPRQDDGGDRSGKRPEHDLGPTGEREDGDPGRGPDKYPNFLFFFLFR